MTIDNYEPLKQEIKILDFWQKNNIHQKAKKKNQGKKPFYFLDGPPYTSGKVHIGTAWNKSLKDSILRFKRMNGFDVWDRAGYDMHGLPIEHQITKKHKLDTKAKIIKFGLAKFVEECKSFAINSMNVMNKDFQRLGTWMDYKDAYRPITEESMEAIWWLIKKVHEKKRLYEGLRTMTWCSTCETALAKHELEYKQVSDNSIFLKFKIKNKDNEFLLIWTTTPWTIPLNLGVMAGPEIDYVKVKVDDEIYIIAKALSNVFIQGLLNKKFKIIEEFKGKKLEGLEYDPALNDELNSIYNRIKDKSKKAFTVLMSEEYVDTTAGTGLVHMAPGCGPEDYEVGHKNGIPPFNPLDEKGIFPVEMGPFQNLQAKKDDKKFIEHFRNKGILIESTIVDHDYAHCWRCHQPVIYRATKQWFFKIEDLKIQMVKDNQSIKWIPKAGFNAFDSWLKNLRDNSITKQRFWGTPLPVWKCKSCNNFDVLASRKEIKEISNQTPEKLHKPWIDKIKYKCKCGGQKERIPDIMDVWIDPGCASWISLNYPKKTDLFKKLFPADFILEGKDQYRGWFNVLMVCSTLALNKPSFKSCYVHGFVQDSKGRKMSKSLGNYILPSEVVDKWGADTLRYYMIAGANPGIDINYNFDDMKVKHKNFIIFWNIHKFIIEQARLLKKNPDNYQIDPKRLGIEEKFILSRLNSTIKKVTNLYNEYKLNEVPEEVEKLFLDLSRVYIQLTREKSSMGTQQEKDMVLWILYKVYMETLLLFCPVAPFFTEIIYQNFKESFKLKQESIHISDWPFSNNEIIDEDLEGDMDITQNLIQSILSGREKLHTGVRWPIKEVIIITHQETVKKSIERFQDIIKKHTNIKVIQFQEKLHGLKLEVEVDKGKLGKDFGAMTPKLITAINKENDILEKIEKKGKYLLMVDKKEFPIEKRHLIITKDIPKDFQEAEFWHGYVYLNKQQTPELEAEGFSRELTRRIQDLRKNNGLKKENIINLQLTGNNDIINRLKPFNDSIQEKVGAKKFDLTKKITFKIKDKANIKGKEFEIGIEIL